MEEFFFNDTFGGEPLFVKKPVGKSFFEFGAVQSVKGEDKTSFFFLGKFFLIGDFKDFFEEGGFFGRGV